jgi:hypothetical protein
MDVDEAVSERIFICYNNVAGIMGTGEAREGVIRDAPPGSATKTSFLQVSRGTTQGQRLGTSTRSGTFTSSAAVRPAD